MWNCVRQKKKFYKIFELCMLLAAVLLAYPLVAQAEEVSLSGDAESGYYINMPAIGTNELLIHENVQTFKVYDNGGKDYAFGSNCNGYLLLTAPTGYSISLSGNVITEGNMRDYLRMYDGNSTQSGQLGAHSEYESSTGVEVEFVTSSSNQVLLYFQSDGSIEKDGVDLTVSVGKIDADYNITVDNHENGTVDVLVNDTGASTARGREMVTVVGTPKEGYDLTGVEVTDALGRKLVVTGGFWYTNNTCTFLMPAIDVNVKCTFVNTSTGENEISQTIPVSGTKELKIARDVRGFKVYGSGGKNGGYAINGSGYLLLTVPEGFIMKISGICKTEKIEYDYLTVYDGNVAEESAIVGSTSKYGSPNNETVDIIVSSGNQLLLYFKSDGSNAGSGVDITVKLSDLNRKFDLEVNEPINGKVTFSVEDKTVTSAAESELVAVTATPNAGYTLTGLKVYDAEGNLLESKGGTWHTGNVATFLMPEGNAKVYPEFTVSENMTDEMYQNIPGNGSVTIGIPREIESFKLYDNGGSAGDYTNNCESYTYINVPKGYVLELTGTVCTENNNDYLRVYDGMVSEETLLGTFMGPNGVDVGTQYSKDNNMVLYFRTDGSIVHSGLDLTVKKRLVDYSILYDLDEGEWEGTPISSYTVENDDIILGTPVREGYYFTGWTGTDLEEPTMSVKIAAGSYGDRSYQATWEKRKELQHEDIQIDVAKQTYTGAFCNSVVVKDKDQVLVQNTDYTVEYKQGEENIEAPICVGDYDVIITGIGKYCDTVNAVLTIDKAMNPPLLPEASMHVSYEVVTVGSATLPKGWIWTETDKKKELSVGSEVKAVALYNGEDKGNYVKESMEITIIRDACTHVWDEGVITKEATAVDEGEKKYTCTICGQEKNEKIAALGVPVVGTIETDASGAGSYKIDVADIHNGTVTYMAPSDKTLSDVIIPDTVVIGGVTYRVTAIEKNAFKDNNNLKKVVIGKYIKTIGNNAFANCKKLKTVKFGVNVTSIGDKAFYKCTALTKVSLPSKVKTIGKSAFEGCKKITSVTIGKSVTKIGSKAFYGCNKIKTLTIKSTKLTTKKIGSKAFAKTPKRMTVKIPKKKLKSYKTMLVKRGVNKKAKFKKN